MHINKFYTQFKNQNILSNIELPYRLLCNCISLLSSSKFIIIINCFNLGSTTCYILIIIMIQLHTFYG